MVGIIFFTPSFFHVSDIVISFIRCFFTFFIVIILPFFLPMVGIIFLTPSFFHVSNIVISFIRCFFFTFFVVIILPFLRIVSFNCYAFGFFDTYLLIGNILMMLLIEIQINDMKVSCVR